MKTPHISLTYKKYRFNVKVNKKDIENGQPENSFSCPVAIAIARAARKTKGNISAAVTQEEVEIIADEFSLIVDLPKKIKRFVERFDEDKSVKPISFILKFEAST